MNIVSEIFYELKIQLNILKNQINHLLLTLIFYDLLVNASPRSREVLFMYSQTRLAWKSSLLFYNLVMNLKKIIKVIMNCRQGNIRRGKLLLSLQHVQNDLKSQLRIEID